MTLVHIPSIQFDLISFHFFEQAFVKEVYHKESDLNKVNNHGEAFLAEAKV